MEDDDFIKDSVIDHLESVIEKSKKQLDLVKCPQHGQALKKLDFLRSEGRFKIETCCDLGEELVEKEISRLG